MLISHVHIVNLPVLFLLMVGRHHGLNSYGDGAWTNVDHCAGLLIGIDGEQAGKDAQHEAQDVIGAQVGDKLDDTALCLEGKFDDLELDLGDEFDDIALYVGQFLSSCGFADKGTARALPLY